MPYTFAQRASLAIVPRVAALLIRALGATLRYEDVVDVGATQGDLWAGPSVYAFWHQSLLACAYRFRNRNVAILISRSFDGELIARTVERLGFRVVRGSSSRGGTTALRQMSEAYAEGFHCAFTADGPRGPAMMAKPGAAQLARLVGTSWVGAFYVYPLRAWRLKTWDGFLIPRPFSRVLVTWPMHATANEEQVQSVLDRSVEMVRAAQTAQHNQQTAQPNR